MSLVRLKATESPYARECLVRSPIFGGMNVLPAKCKVKVQPEFIRGPKISKI